MLAVALDTASELAGVAALEDGALLASLTWRTRQNHSRELLPNLEQLLRTLGRTKADIGGVIVCTGPGSYAGLRVGVSTAKGLAYALELPIVGTGRLAAEAAPRAFEGGAAVHALHAAGRAELAHAAYRRTDGRLEELRAPSLVARDALLERIGAGEAVCGDVDEELAVALRKRGASVAPPLAGRVVAVAALGWQRLAAGDQDEARSLVPLYLREPAIGPQGR